MPGKRKPNLDAKAAALSKYTLQDILKLKFTKDDQFRPGKTIQKWIKDTVAPQLKQYITSEEVMKKVTDGGFSLQAHLVIVVGSRHILIWDMDCNGDLVEEPYLAMSS